MIESVHMIVQYKGRSMTHLIGYADRHEQVAADGGVQQADAFHDSRDHHPAACGHERHTVALDERLGNELRSDNAQP